MKVRLLLILSICLFYNSCNGDKMDRTITNSPDSLAVYYYKLRIQQNYDTYVDSMESCKNMPEEYKQNIVKLLKNHHNEIVKSRKGTASVKVLRKEMHNNGKMAQVYLDVCYKDGSHEEVLFPLVLNGGSWKIQ